MSLDWQLYRLLYSPNDNPIWGRFPHPPMAELASKLEVSTNTIWRKLTEWRRTGFLRGYFVLPHPQLLGIGLSEYALKVAGPVEKEKVIADLELTDGVIYSCDEVGSRVNLVVVTDREEAQRRRKELISRLPGVVTVGATKRVWLPPCHGFLSARDWSLVKALRNSPEDSIGKLARRTKFSVRTVSRHLARMRQTHAVLSLHLENWMQFPGTIAGFRLTLEPGHDSRKVGRELLKVLPDSVEAPSLATPPGAQNDLMAYVTQVNSGPMIDAVVKKALEVPGVARADPFFPGSERSYSGWLDEHIDLLQRLER